MRMKGNLFLGLILLFLIYSYCVYTAGTKSNSSFLLSPMALEGKKIFQKHNCIACHQLYGLGGYLGPDLTTIISEKGKGKDYAKAFIRVGSKRMPDFKLSDSEIECLLEYFNSVDQTAINYKCFGSGMIPEK